MLRESGIAEYVRVQRVRIPSMKNILRVSTFEADDWEEENRPEVKLEPQCHRAAGADSGSGDHYRKGKEMYFEMNTLMSIQSLRCVLNSVVGKHRSRTG